MIGRTTAHDYLCDMKILAIFMTALMAFAGIDFCKDSDTAIASDTVLVSAVDDAAHCDSRVCNPFCRCVRCPFSVLLSQPQSLVLCCRLLTPGFPLIDAAHPVRVSVPVWQPPQRV